MSSSPPVLIVGTGALACLFAARLAAVNIPVMMLGTWPEGVAALRSGGVTLVEADGSEQRYPVRVIVDPTDSDQAEFALVLVKSWQTERAAHQLKVCLPMHGHALTLQNGLGNHQKLAKHLGAARVSQGVTTVGGTMLSPGRVRSGGEGLISIERNPQLKLFVEIFQQANFSLEKTSEIETLIWGKLTVNAAINPLTAVLGVPNGDLLTQPYARVLMSLAASEVATLADAKGIHLPFDDISAAVEEVARRTASNYSSMLQDIRRGAPTEIEVINGAIIQAADQINMRVPVNQTLYYLVKSIVDMKSKLRLL